MISHDYARLMARYSAWQNDSLARAGDTLDDAARRADRGAFFGSIFATLNHLLWGDRTWLGRFAGAPPPAVASITETLQTTPDWATYRSERAVQDKATMAWATALTPADLDRDLTWYSGAVGREVTKPMGLLVVQFFNHGTHHRGQVHAMLTAAGARPDDTDLFLLPDG